MTVIVDTGVLYADHDTNATRHEAVKEALESVYGANWGCRTSVIISTMKQ